LKDDKHEKEDTLNIRDVLAEIDEEILMADGFDDAVIGYAQRCGQPALVVYDRDKCIEVLMKDGMTHEEAEEYFEFNVVGSWVGERTPLFLCRVNDS
jgi:hypothetical protein